MALIYVGFWGLPVAALPKAGAGRVAVELPMALVQAPGQVGRQRQVAQRRRRVDHRLVAGHVPQAKQLRCQHLRARPAAPPRD